MVVGSALASSALAHWHKISPMPPAVITIGLWAEWSTMFEHQKHREEQHAVFSSLGFQRQANGAWKINGCVLQQGTDQPA